MAQLASGQVPEGSVFRPPAPVENIRALPDVEPADDRFRFVDDNGVEWVSDRSVKDVLTPGLFRRHRDNELELYFAIIEGLFEPGSEAMDVIDGSWAVTKRVSEALGPHVQTLIGVTLGE